MLTRSAIYFAILRLMPLRTILRARRARDSNEIVRTLSPILAGHAHHRVVRAMEDLCTPLEFAEALSRPHMFSGPTRKALAEISIAKLLKESAPEPYQRFRIAPHVALYRNPETPSRNKCLVIVLGGLSHRPFTPRVAFMQYLPASRFDVAFLRDEARTSFEGGIPDYADSIRSLAERLAADLDVATYQRIVLFGVSIAGLTALRLGILLDAERAISVGGQYNWHVGRILKGKSIPAFDVLCECGPRASTRLIYAHGNNFDARQLQRLALTHKVERLLINETREHNIIQFLIETGRFRQFLAQVLDG